jgi:hypothetical protein
MSIPSKSTALAPRQDDPAADAADLLMRIALGVLAIGLPVASILSRRAVFSLMPVGCILVLAAALVAPTPGSMARLRAAVRSPIGFCLAFLIFWAILTLAWTPFPGMAVARLVKVIGILALATLTAAFLPERTRVANIYLVPIGLTVAAAAALLVVLRWHFFSGGTVSDPLVTERAAMSMVMYLWPALAALAARQRFSWGGALAILIAVAVIGLWAPVALAALAAGALAVALSMSQPRRAGEVLALAFGLLIFGAPFIALIVTQVIGAAPGLFEPAATWGGIIKGEWPRLITGHGLETAISGIMRGYLPPQTPRGLLFECWYELGVIGAIATALAVAAAFVAAGRIAPLIAPFVLASLVAGLTIAIWSEGSAQIWWVSLLSAVAVMFVCVVRGQYRTNRPAAKVTNEPLPPRPL